MVTLDSETFSDGRTLTQWLIANGAPALLPDLRYRLLFGSDGGATKVTAQILKSSNIVSEFTTRTRVSAAMAAVSAATYAFEDMYD